MSYNIILANSFKREFKKLRKKHKSLSADLLKLIVELETNPTIGTSIGKDCYKIRIAITSKGKGKSGGARVISHFYVFKDEIILLSIYDKSDKSTITEKEIQQLLNQIK